MNNKRSIDGLLPRDPNKKRRNLADFDTQKTTKKNIIEKVESKKAVKVIDWGDLVGAKEESSKTTITEAVAEDFLKPVEAFKIKESKNKKKFQPIIKTKRPRLFKFKLRYVGLILIVLIVAGVAGAYVWGDSIVSKVTGGKSGIIDVISAIVENKKVELKQGMNKRTNILVFGTSGYDMGGSGHDGAQLTDSIMLVSLDQKNKDVAMLSLPRDLKMSWTCTATRKINEIYFCNNLDRKNEEKGAMALARQIEEITGVDISYYVHVNWGALVQLVDSIGGITVTLDEDIMEGNIYTQTNIKKGVPTKLNGEKALGLARARHGAVGGDYSRMNSQQKILIAIKDKVTEGNLGVDKIIGLFNTLGDNLRTNFNIEEIKTLGELGKVIKPEEIRQVKLIDWSQNINYLQGKTINGIYYTIPKAGEGVYSEIKKFVKRELSNDALLRENAKIMVLNGAKTSGVAGMEREKLERDNFVVEKIGDAPEGKYEHYEIYDISGDKIGTKKRLSAFYGKEIKSKDKLPSKIQTQGVDFVIIVGPIE